MTDNNAKKLINALRRSSSEERHEKAFDVARIPGNAGFDELKRMLAGKRKFWFSLYNKSAFYDLNDACIALEAMGSTARTDVLDYLKEIYTERVNTVDNDEIDCLEGRIMDSWKVDLHEFPNAPEILRQGLFYCDDPYSKYYFPPLEWPAHRAIRNAIARLKKDLANHYS